MQHQEVYKQNKKKKKGGISFFFLTLLQLNPIFSQLHSTNICCLPSLCKALCWVLGIQKCKVKIGPQQTNQAVPVAVHRVCVHSHPADSPSHAPWGGFLALRGCPPYHKEPETHRGHGKHWPVVPHPESSVDSSSDCPDSKAISNTSLGQLCNRPEHLCYWQSDQHGQSFLSLELLVFELNGYHRTSRSWDLSVSITASMWAHSYNNSLFQQKHIHTENWCTMKIRDKVVLRQNLKSMQFFISCIWRAFRRCAWS